MKKIVCALISILIYGNMSFGSTLSLNSKIKDGNSVNFLKYSGPGAFDSYLAMNLPYKPAADLLAQLQSLQEVVLKSRGEAHITVVTPVEFWNVLKPQGITMIEINQIAESLKIQNSKFEIKCVGVGQAKLVGKVEKTFFLVVESPDLVNIRHKIALLFLEKGGSPNAFNPGHFYPHITLGFTNRDLHESDGVVKDSGLCVYNLILSK